MAHQVPWNKIIVETFIEEAMLTKEEDIRDCKKVLDAIDKVVNR